MRSCEPEKSLLQLCTGQYMIDGIFKIGMLQVICGNPESFSVQLTGSITEQRFASLDVSDQSIHVDSASSVLLNLYSDLQQKCKVKLLSNLTFIDYCQNLYVY